MLIQESQLQGKGKSEALSILGGEWYGEGVKLGDDAKLMIENTKRKWICEIGELANRSNREVDHIKHQISCKTDTARLSYDRYTSDVPRQFILCGTTNDERYLKDPSGNRRFMPVTIDKVDLEALKRDKGQLWAEAYHKVTVEELEANIPEELWPRAAEVQAERLVEDPVAEVLADWFGHREGLVDKKAVYAAIADTKLPRGCSTSPKAITQAMQKIGWLADRQRKPGFGRNDTPVHCYSKPGSDVWFFWNGEARQFDRL